MDTAQWPQDIELEKTMEENMAGSDAARLASEKRARPQEQLNCPRCNSTNTKFCYYNNYSLTQPRYFCKTCRRYWTEGGTLRNVPVGGGSRKNKKSISSSMASSSGNSSSKSLIPDLNPPSLSHFSSPNPRMSSHEGQDLKIAFSNVEHYNGSAPHYVDHHQQMVKMEGSNVNTSALELLRNTGIASRGVNSYIPNSMQDSNGVIYAPSGFSLQEFKPSQLGFCVDGLGNRYSESNNSHENGGSGRLLFPFGDLKQISSNNGSHHELDQNKGQGNPTGYWNGLMGGGAW